MTILSKSRLISFRQCPKRMWLEIHRPELREDSKATLASYRVGHSVGEVARRLYDPEGHSALIDVNAGGFAGALERSRQLLAAGERTVFEAGFSAGGAFALADVMIPVQRGSGLVWRMVEVKSSTSVKDYHRDDVAIQAYVAREAGVPLESLAVACIDGTWIYPGDEDYRGLLVETELSDEAFERHDEVKGWVSEASTVAERRDEPEVAMGPQCQDPFACGFCAYCRVLLPQAKHPVEWLPKLTQTQRKTIEGSGAIEMADVPDSLLNTTQLRVKKHTLEGSVFFDAEGAKSDLAGCEPPFYFLDFETVQFAVPIWKGTRPYQQIPFQFSLHVVARNGPMRHSEFLDLTGRDPSESFAKALIEAVGDTGAIFAYNAAFEKSRIAELADRLPRLRRALGAIDDRIVDLLPVARNRFYHPAQHGSWSIKALIGAAFPDISYEKLEGVRDGGMAMEAFVEAITLGTTPERVAAIDRQLRDYCQLDTLAMVRLWELFRG